MGLMSLDQAVPNVVKRAADKTFYAPLKWAEPKKIFTCSWSDFFIEEADPWRDEAFAIMALTPQHTYQVLTKRPDRMYKYLTADTFPDRLEAALQILCRSKGMPAAFDIPWGEVFPWPLPNVWLGVSAEDRATYITRVPFLAMTPGATKFLSFEPLLGDIGDLMLDGIFQGSYHWAIAGGESGPDARPTHPDWLRSIRDQCADAGVAFHFKQWGEWLPSDGVDQPAYRGQHRYLGDHVHAYRVGKKAAGRLLDGREHNDFPEVSR